MPLKIVRNDITKMNTDAIVNTANEYVAVGPGCDTAIYQAAGHDELLQYRKENIGPVPEGEVFITPGFQLPAKYIIHAVSPLFIDGDSGEEEKLRSCYRKSLQLAKENQIRSIAFPLISTGSFGYPLEEGIRIAADEINAFLLANDMLVYIVVFGRRATSLGTKLYPDLEEYIDQNYVEIKKVEESGYYNRPLPGAAAPPAGSAPSGAAKAPMGSAPAGAARAPEDSSLSGAQGIFGNFRRRRATLSRADEEAELSEMSLEEPSDSFMQSSASFIDDIELHESKIDERMAHLSDTFSEYLMHLIESKGLKNADVYKRAIIDKKIFSKIKTNPHYQPKKITALCLCIGAKLNLDETIDLLARAGLALSPCDKTDVIFKYFIENEHYDMVDLDIVLEEHGLPCIIK